MKKNAGYMLIELLVVLAIIAFIVLKMLNNYHKPPISKETQKVMSEQGVDTASYSSIKSSIKNKLEKIQQQQQDDLSKM